MENKEKKDKVSTKIKTSSIKEKFMELPGRVLRSFRNSQVWGFFVSMAVMAVISIAFFYPDNFEGNTLAQPDMIQGKANGHASQVYEQETGQKALWTNALFSGMPTFQIAPDYPSNSLFTWINTVYGLGLPVPSNLMFMMMFGFLIMLTCLRLRWWYSLIGAVAWGLSSYFVIIIGAGHIWKFVALAYVPPTIGALIMIYQGRKIAGAAILSLFLMMELNANHPQITYYFGFLMLFLIVGFLIKSLKDKNLKQWLVRSAVFVCACALSFGANLPSLYNTYEYSKETKRSASELTPLPSATVVSDGDKPTGGLPKSEIGGWSNLPEESFSLLIPNIKGGASIKPVRGGIKPVTLSESEHFTNEMRDQEPYVMTSDGRGGQIPIIDNLYGYTAGQGGTMYFGGKGITNGPFYVGALIFALFLLGCFVVNGPVKWVLLITTIFSALLAMGNHFEALTDFMIFNVPLYNKFRAAETALVLACLCMPLLGILGLYKVFTTPEALKQRNIVRGLSVAFVFPCFVCLMACISPSIFGTGLTPAEIDFFSELPARFTSEGYIFDPAQITATVENVQKIRFEALRHDALRSLGFLLAGACVMFFAMKRRLRFSYACLLLAAVVVTDLYTVDKRYVNAENFTKKMLTKSLIEADDADKQIMADKSYYRVADLQGFGDARRSYFHNMIGGYHAAKLNRYNDLLERRLYPSLSNIYSLIVSDVMEGIEPTGSDWNLISMLNTKYIIIPSGENENYVYENKKAQGPAWLVGDVRYVENADREMSALAEIDPATEAVADKRFAELLGDQRVALSQGDYIRLDKQSPDKLEYTVETKQGGVAVFSEVWFPWGWRAEIDGKEVSLGRVNYVLRALKVPAGKHKIEMVFDPQSIHVTSSVAYASVTLIYILCALALFMGVIGGKRDNEAGTEPTLS